MVSDGELGVICDDVWMHTRLPHRRLSARLRVTLTQGSHGEEYEGKFNVTSDEQRKECLFESGAMHHLHRHQTIMVLSVAEQKHSTMAVLV